MGRSEIISKSGKVSSSYSCGVCCTNSFYRGNITPLSVFSDIGDYSEFTANQQDRDCYGNYYSWYPVSANWTSDDTSIAEMDAFIEGRVNAMDGGTTAIRATWFAEVSTDLGGGECDTTGVTVNVSSNMSVRPRVLDVAASGATYITQVVGDTNIIHFVTPKGAANSQVTLTATIQYSDIHVPNDIDWEGATESPNNPFQATLSKDTASKNVVKIKYRGNVIKELRVWVVWATTTSSDIPISVIPGNTVTGNPPGSALALQGGYNFTHTISPATIITDTDKPDFCGDPNPSMCVSNMNAPPGGNHPIYGSLQPLSGGANKKWDGSRQIRFKVFNPNNINVNDTGYYKYGIPANVLNYPSDDVEGNDDSSTNDEVNEPYSQNTRGILTATDPTQFAIAHRGGANGDTFEIRYHFREFARLEIEGTWYRISDFYLWRIHYEFLKTNGVWIDNGTNKALDNSGF